MNFKVGKEYIVIYLKIVDQAGLVIEFGSSITQKLELK